MSTMFSNYNLRNEKNILKNISGPNLKNVIEGVKTNNRSLAATRLGFKDIIVNRLKDNGITGIFQKSNKEKQLETLFDDLIQEIETDNISHHELSKSLFEHNNERMISKAILKYKLENNIKCALEQKTIKRQEKKDINSDYKNIDYIKNKNLKAISACIVINEILYPDTLGHIILGKSSICKDKSDTIEYKVGNNTIWSSSNITDIERIICSNRNVIDKKGNVIIKSLLLKDVYKTIQDNIEDELKKEKTADDLIKGLKLYRHVGVSISKNDIDMIFENGKITWLEIAKISSINQDHLRSLNHFITFLEQHAPDKLKQFIKEIKQLQPRILDYHSNTKYHYKSNIPYYHHVRRNTI